MKFTRASIATLALPLGQTDVIFWDDALPGFGVRLRAGGSRRFIVQYREEHGGTRRAALGAIGVVSLDEARDKARKVLAQVRLGGDPQAEKAAARKAKRVVEIVEDYLADAAKRLKPRSLAETTRHLKVHAKALHHQPAVGVGRADVAELLAKIERDSGPVAANRVRSSLSAMWGWAMMEGLLDDNPVTTTRKREETSRERVLSDAELALIWQCTDDKHDHSRIVRLLMLTGLRREEIGGAAWAELDGDMLVIPGSRTKNGLPLEVPIPPLAMTQLPPRRNMKRSGEPRMALFGKRASEGFSGWSRCKARLDERIHGQLIKKFATQHAREPVEGEVVLIPWTLHDLRRTLATWLSEHGEEPHIVEALLNHASGRAKAGVAGVYNRAVYREPKRTALVRWAEHIADITDQSTSNMTTKGRS